MKFNYTNILLFSLSLNILLLSSQVYNQRNHYITPYTENTKTMRSYRSLCECELYTSIYDTDPEMKTVMENFHRQTSQRLKEYDGLKIKNRQKCKEQCDNEIQQIILKDKVEKELTETLGVLHIDIRTSDIPTCVCKKSLEDKTEKLCHNFGYGLGGALTSWEILGYTGIYGWENFATALAKEIAIKKGIKVSIEGIKKIYDLGSRAINFEKLVIAENFNHPMYLGQAVQGLSNTICDIEGAKEGVFCGLANDKPAIFARGVATFSRDAADAGAAEFSRVMGEKTVEISTTTSNFSNVMIASGITILVIILIMIIIYLILRYRRKKKMKKKLQYIKLLEE